MGVMHTGVAQSPQCAACQSRIAHNALVMSSMSLCPLGALIQLTKKNKIWLIDGWKGFI